jgi:sugar lactone lactonase YvrE
MSPKPSYRHALLLAMGLVLAATCIPDFATAEEQHTYVFDRMWPTLKQPWYFLKPSDVAFDNGGNVYVSDSSNSRIQKFTSSGVFVTYWGRHGVGLGEFDVPIDVAVDATGNVYVADVRNNRIQKFTTTGVFMTSWGSTGIGPGQFLDPNSVAVDATGFVYVADTHNHRIQKFTASGAFVTSWGSFGSEPGQFHNPNGVVTDGSGSVYVADTLNHRIQKFTASGTFVTSWGSFGFGPGQFSAPLGVAVDASRIVYVADAHNNRIQMFTASGVFLPGWMDGQFANPNGVSVDLLGNVYVADTYNHRIQKFTASGAFVSAWESQGSKLGQFGSPDGIAVDAAGNIYVADSGNHRIQKFAASGAFVTSWGSFGTEHGQFDSPNGIAVDASGNVFVSDASGHRIQRFTAAGEFVTTWGSYGFGPGEFISPVGVAVDASGNVYVTDWGNARIQKFTASGAFVTSWGSFGTEQGQFDSPNGIAIDASGNVYVSDASNHRVQKFTAAGEFVTTWGSYGFGQGEFISPVGIAVDASGNVYVTDWGNARIQKFASSGAFQTSWGEFGSERGQFGSLGDVAVDASGNVYVTDTTYNRIQKFKPVTIVSNAKSIVLAAGGAFSGNNLWDATQFCANFCYRTLAYQGFRKDTIRYFSSDSQLDLDNNALPDDVNGDVTNTNLHAAVIQWASGADSLVLYLVDHGGDQAFRMSGTETLNAFELKSWLDQVDPTIAGPIIVVYEACQSGSFLDVLSGPNRIIITSTQANESAYFLSTGTISFSSFFWTYVFNGSSVRESFDAAVAAVGQSIILQNPQISDPNNLAPTTYIGTGTKLEGDAPVIGAVSQAQVISGTATAELVADPVTDTDGVQRVWAVIQPPDFVPPLTDNPVQSLPSLELVPAAQDSPHWSGVYDGFTSEGTYTIAIYAMDRQTNTSSPKITSVSVSNPRSHKALIVAGGTQDDPLWTSYETGLRTVYNALRGQGYSDDEIRFYSPVTFVSGVDGLNALSNVHDAITTWAVENTQDLVVALVGPGTNESFALGAGESISRNQLDTWLDTLQTTLPSPVTVVHDATGSGNFIQNLTPPTGKLRYLVTSTSPDETAAFIANGDVSFSNYFWRRILNGATVGDAFTHARVAVRFSNKSQRALLECDSDGQTNRIGDEIAVRNFRLGAGILLAGDDPIIGSVSPGQSFPDGVASVTIFADQVTSVGTIARVWALVTPPGSKAEPVLYDLAHTGGTRYEVALNDFSVDGRYEMAIYAKDAEGTVSTPSLTFVQIGPETPADVDSNGEIDAVDVQLVINGALGLGGAFDCDIDASGGVDAVDVQLVVNAALGL